MLRFLLVVFMVQICLRLIDRYNARLKPELFWFKSFSLVFQRFTSWGDGAKMRSIAIFGR